MWSNLYRKNVLGPMLAKLDELPKDKAKFAPLYDFLAMLKNDVLKDKAAAEEYYKLAAGYLPSGWHKTSVLNKLLDLYTEQERWQEALDAQIAWEQAGRRSGRTLSAADLARRGTFLSKLGRTREANAIYEQCLQDLGTSENDVQQRLNIAVNLLIGGSYRKAAEQLVMVNSLLHYYQKQDFAARQQIQIGLAAALFGLERPEQGLAVLASDPTESTHAIGNYVLEKMMDPLNQTTSVDALAAACEDRAKNNLEMPLVRAVLGAMLQKQGDLARAEQQYEAACRVLPFNTDLRGLLERLRSKRAIPQ